jgi:hypothetical protein
MNPNQTMLSGVNEVTCLEYGQLKVHYEILNKKFRAAQKVIDQHNFYFKRGYDVIDDTMKKANDSSSAPIKSVSIIYVHSVTSICLDRPRK